MAADFLPRMREEEYQRLKVDIAENGLHVPILRWRGQIIDGRHRDRACRELGIEPRYEDVDDDSSVLDLIIALNVNRRQLTKSQTALFAARIANRRPGRPTKTPNFLGVSQEEAAAKTGISVELVRQAKLVIEQGVPELVRRVERGKIAVGDASEVAKLNQHQQREWLARGTDALVAVAKKPKAATMRPDAQASPKVKPGVSTKPVGKPPTSGARRQEDGRADAPLNNRVSPPDARFQTGFAAAQLDLAAGASLPPELDTTSDDEVREPQCDASESSLGTDEAVGAVDATLAGVQPRLSDTEWLQTLSIRRELKDPRKFDKAALLWRQAEPHVAAIVQMCDFSATEVSQSSNWNLSRMDIRLRWGSSLLITPPDRWTICGKCRGTDPEVQCSSCAGRGFNLTHSGTPRQSEPAAFK